MAILLRKRAAAEQSAPEDMSETRVFEALAAERRRPAAQAVITPLAGATYCSSSRSSRPRRSPSGMKACTREDDLEGYAEGATAESEPPSWWVRRHRRGGSASGRSRSRPLCWPSRQRRAAGAAAGGA